MKTWQVVVLIYLVAAIVGVEFGIYHLPIWLDMVAALGITTLGILLIRRLKMLQNPSK